jgi:expansin (peptidoglycan-binding protein)
MGLVLTVAACSHEGAAPGGAPGVPFGEPQTGEGTYYAADGSGNCMFDKSPGDLDVAAMNAVQYAGAATCGQCVRVTGPKGEVTVRIVDQCPGCKKGDLDLSPQAFDKIGEHSAGRIPISWSAVPCAVSGNVAYRYKEGSSQYWTAIQVRNHRLPITRLELRKGDAWMTVPREPYNYFVAAGGAGPGMVGVRITAVDGQVLEDALPAVTDGGLVHGAAQFR